MIFARINYPGHYDDHHFELLRLLELEFEIIESGFQGDSWIWVYDSGHKVAIDSFSSMQHEVKSDTLNNPLVARVLKVLKKTYAMSVFEPPEFEAHEE